MVDLSIPLSTHGYTSYKIETLKVPYLENPDKLIDTNPKNW